MKDMTKEFDEKCYKNKNPLVRWYFYKLLKTAVQISKTKKEDTILDFGCCKKRLKQFLPKETKYLGYDIDPKLSMIKDYKKTRPTTVFAINVLEHLDERQLTETLKEFKKMGVKKIIIGNPTINTISKIVIRLSGLSKAIKTHNMTFVGVNKCLKENGLIQTKYKSIINKKIEFNRIGVWKWK